jgi:hypothetical protein
MFGEMTAKSGAILMIEGNSAGIQLDYLSALLR